MSSEPNVLETYYSGTEGGSAILISPSAERNKQPILEVLQQYLNDSTRKVLEIASGSGQHMAHFAPHFPNIIWQPSEKDPRSIHSINAYLDKYQFSNVRVPIFLDISKPIEDCFMPEDFGFNQVDVLISINLIHISSNAAVDGLFETAGKLLRTGGLLITYGAYSVDGKITPQSNVDFDQMLRRSNPEWGLRDTDFLKQKALSNGLTLKKMHDMPANNKTLIFQKEAF